MDNELLEKLTYNIQLKHLSFNGIDLSSKVTIKNTSEFSIYRDMFGSPMNIGILVKSDTELVHEARFDGKIPIIAPGEEGTFEVSAHFFDYPSKNLSIIIDLVVENTFWVSEVTSNSNIQEVVECGESLSFDYSWYADKYQLPKKADKDLIRDHFFELGARNGCNPNPLTQSQYLLHQSGYNNIPHDAQNFHELLVRFNPHPFLPKILNPGTCNFDLSQPSISTYFNQSLNYLVERDTYRFRYHPFFDPFFLAQVEGAKKMGPLRYYLTNLYESDFKISSLFDADYYLSDSAISREVNSNTRFKSAIDHFLQVGIKQDLAPIPDFDKDFYLMSNPEAAEVVSRGEISACEHFFFYGMIERRNPNEFFDTSYYIQNQPNVLDECRALNILSPFEHFLRVGYKRRYKARQPLVEVTVPDHFGKSLYEKRCALTTRGIIAQKDKIVFPEISDTVDLSIVVPVHDQFQMTIHLLEQLSDFAWRSDTATCQVVVVDNGSHDLTRKLSDYVENITICREDRALGYPSACNIGANVAVGRIILFCNNDIEVSSRNLQRGVDAFNSDVPIGAISGMIVLMNGQVQEAGSAIYRNAGTTGIGRHADPYSPLLSFRREADFVSGCYLFCKRENFKSVGGFDEEFSPGYYEETDLCLRLAQEGLSIIYDPSLITYHYEYASFSKGRPPSISTSLMTRNRELFSRKHSEKLVNFPQPDENINSFCFQRRLRDNRFSVLLVEDLPVDPKLGSGFVRSRDTIDTLVSLGHRVTVAVCNFAYSDAHLDLCPKGVNIINLFSGENQNPLLGSELDFDIVWICRTHNFDRYGLMANKAKLVNPDLKLVFDTEALVADRDFAFRKLNHLPIPNDIDLELENELCFQHDPDVYISVSDRDKSRIEEINATVQVNTLGHGIRVEDSVRKNRDGRSGIAFCGAFFSKESPNYDSLKWFLDYVWPILTESNVDLEFKISGPTGYNVDLSELCSRYNNVRYLGVLDSVSEGLLDQSLVFVAPTRFAAGIPHKVHTALAAGIPCVCTDLLATQIKPSKMKLENLPVLSSSCEDAKKFAENCAKLLENEKLWLSQHEKGINFMRKHHSMEQFEEALDNILSSL